MATVVLRHLLLLLEEEAERRSGTAVNLEEEKPKRCSSRLFICPTHSSVALKGRQQQQNKILGVPWPSSCLLLEEEYLLLVVPRHESSTFERR